MPRNLLRPEYMPDPVNLSYEMNRLALGRSARAQQAHKVDNRIDRLHKVDNRFDRLRALHKTDTDTQTTVVSVDLSISWLVFPGRNCACAKYDDFWRESKPCCKVHEKRKQDA